MILYVICYCRLATRFCCSKDKDILISLCVYFWSSLFYNRKEFSEEVEIDLLRS